MGLMSQKAYAEKRRVSPQYINKLVSQGKIRKVGRQIDSKQADAAIAAFRRAGRVLKPSRSKHTAKPAKKAARKSAKGPKAPRVVVDIDGPAPELLDPSLFRTPTGSITASRAVSEFYDALRRKTAHERDIGKLLPAEQVLEAERKKNTTLRTLLESLPRALAPMLAVTIEAAECEAIVKRALDQIREEFIADPLGLKSNDVQVEAPPPAVEIPVPPPDVPPVMAEGASA